MLRMLRSSFAALLGAVLVMSSCSGTARVARSPSLTFDRGSTIAAVPVAADPQGIRLKLEHLLLARGFNVVSESAARDQVQLHDVEQSDAVTRRRDVTVEAARLVPSAYVLRFDYRTRPDLPKGEVLRSFTATVVDLVSGAVVGSVDYNQGEFGSQSIDSALRDIVDKL